MIRFQAAFFLQQALQHPDSDRESRRYQRIAQENKRRFYRTGDST